jgi:DUF1680 family protein
MDARIETGALSAVAESSLGENGTVKITIASAASGLNSIFIRKPVWAAATDIHVAGNARQYPAGDGYMGIEKAWAAGDGIEVKYGMSLRSFAGGEGRVAYFYGPWLLGAPAADNAAYFNELTADNRLERGKESALAAEKQPKRPFTVPIAATVVPCSPAEYPDQPGTVVLRAVAEQSGMGTTGWELRFLGVREA